MSALPGVTVEALAVGDRVLRNDGAVAVVERVTARTIVAGGRRYSRRTGAEMEGMGGSIEPLTRAALVALRRKAAARALADARAMLARSAGRVDDALHAMHCARARLAAAERDQAADQAALDALPTPEAVEAAAQAEADALGLEVAP